MTPNKNILSEGTTVRLKFVVVLYMGMDFNQFSRDLAIKSSIYEFDLSAGKNNLHFASVLNQTPIQN